MKLHPQSTIVCSNSAHTQLHPHVAITLLQSGLSSWHFDRRMQRFFPGPNGTTPTEKETALSTLERPIKSLGEIALRVKDLDIMQRFYEEVIGLELMRRFDYSAFFKVTDGYAGHTQVLALFDRSKQPGYSGIITEKSTIDHISHSFRDRPC